MPFAPFYTHVVFPFVLILLLSIFYGKFPGFRQGKVPLLRGPANPSFLFGYYRYLNECQDPGAVYEKWVNEYGPAYRLPGGFGSSRIIICDPIALAHFHSRETFVYVQTKLAKIFIENLVSIVYFILRLF